MFIIFIELNDNMLLLQQQLPKIYFYACIAKDDEKNNKNYQLHLISSEIDYAHRKRHT
jgi:hypothetical protein